VGSRPDCRPTTSVTALGTRPDIVGRVLQGQVTPCIMGRSSTMVRAAVLDQGERARGHVHATRTILRLASRDDCHVSPTVGRGSPPRTRQERSAPLKRRRIDQNCQHTRDAIVDPAAFGILETRRQKLRCSSSDAFGAARLTRVEAWARRQSLSATQDGP